MKSKRDGRLCFHIPQNRQQARRFGGFNFSQHHRFTWQDRACAADEARIVNVPLTQSNKEPPGQSANHHESSQKQRNLDWPVVGDHFVFPKNDGANGDSEGRSGDRCANRRDAMLIHAQTTRG
jgi:hypothetical protein